MSVSRSFELINPPAINILAVFLRYFPAFEEGEAFRSCIPSVREIQEIAFGSKNSREAGGWIIQYAGRHGYNAETINRFWNIYTMIDNEDTYKKRGHIMKKRLLLFAILFFGLCGCDKDNGEDVDPPGIGHFV